ncbi:RHS repeat protein, partial [Escherichia coli]|uniref:RHS repeat domain-containing protein n=3 Tax=Pseudomonadota TaxID=1224 RepID=UPI001654CAD3
HAWGDNGLFDYRFVYDRARMETCVTNSLGHTMITQMNERGMPVAEIDPLGGVTGYRYDAQGRTSAVID